MDILGSIGKLYTFILLVILFLGSGLAVWAGINTIMNNKDKMKENSVKLKAGLNSGIRNLQNNKIIGGISMNNNGFIKLAVFSFIGIIISAAILTVLPKYSNTMGNMNSQYSTSNMSMQGMNGSTMQGGMSGNVDLNSIQQQLNNMQQQISQIQGQMNNSMGSMQNNSGSTMNNNNMNNNNMNSGSMNSNSSSGSMSMPMM